MQSGLAYVGCFFSPKNIAMMCLQVTPETTNCILQSKADAEGCGVLHGFQKEMHSQILSLDPCFSHTQMFPCILVHSGTAECEVPRFENGNTFFGCKATHKPESASGTLCYSQDTHHGWDATTSETWCINRNARHFYCTLLLSVFMRS